MVEALKRKTARADDGQSTLKDRKESKIALEIVREKSSGDRYNAATTTQLPLSQNTNWRGLTAYSGAPQYQLASDKKSSSSSSRSGSGSSSSGKSSGSGSSRGSSGSGSSSGSSSSGKSSGSGSSSRSGSSDRTPAPERRSEPVPERRSESVPEESRRYEPRSYDPAPKTTPAPERRSEPVPERRSEPVPEESRRYEPRSYDPAPKTTPAPERRSEPVPERKSEPVPEESRRYEPRSYDPAPKTTPAPERRSEPVPERKTEPQTEPAPRRPSDSSSSGSSSSGSNSRPSGSDRLAPRDSRWSTKSGRWDGKVVTSSSERPPAMNRVQNGYQRYHDYERAHPRDGGHHGGGSGDYRNHGHHSSNVYHPNGCDSRGVPNGYWHYDPMHGFHYVPWDVHHHGYEHYSDYHTNVNYHYSWEHHYYWHNRGFYDYYAYPDYWDRPVVILAPSYDYQYPRYEGPRVTLNEVGDLLRHKESVDKLRYNLMAYPVRDRDSDEYRFRMKDAIDSYHYLIYQTFEQIAQNENGSGWARQFHDDPAYQQVVESLWEESLALLNMYEAEFPQDTAMRGDSVNVLHWNLSQSRLIRYHSADNGFYRRLFEKVGREVVGDS